MLETKTKQPPITLDAAQNPGASVLINDGSGLIVMTMAAAVDSCMEGHRWRGAMRDELKLIAESLQDWYNKHHKDRIAALHATISLGKVLILCAPRGEEYDFELGDDLAALIMQLTSSYRMFSFDAIQSPQEGFSGFAEINAPASEKAAPASH